MREIDKISEGLMKNHGFMIKKTSWYRLTPDFIQIINFQKSYYGNMYYLNVGIDLIEGDIRFQPEYKFSVRLRSETILSGSELIKSLDFESPYNEEQRRQDIFTIINEILIILDAVQRKEDFLKVAQEHPWDKALIIGTFKDKIGLK